MYRGPDPDEVAGPGRGPDSISMVRVRRRDAPGKGETEQYAVAAHKAIGIQLQYPKTWEIQEDSRRLAVFYPADRGVSLNVIVGQLPEGTTLEELSKQALETPKQLQERGLVDPTTALECKPTTFLGIQGYEMGFVVHAGGRLRMARQVWTLIDGKSYILSCGCPVPQVGQFGATFQHIIDSVTLVDPSAVPAIPKRLLVPKALPSVIMLAFHEDEERQFRFKYPSGFFLDVTDKPQGDAPCLRIHQSFTGSVAYDHGHDKSSHGHSHSHGGHSHGGHSHGGQGHSHGGQACTGDHSHGDHEHSHEKEKGKEKEEENSAGGVQHHSVDSTRTIEQQNPEEEVEVAFRVLDSKGEALFLSKLEKASGGVKPTAERVGSVSPKRVCYASEGMKHVHLYFNREGKFYCLSLRYPLFSEEEKPDLAVENVYDHLLRHILQRLEFFKTDKTFASKAHYLTYEHLAAKPKISFTFPAGTFKLQMQAGGPFLVAFVHVVEEVVEVEAEEIKDEEKEKEKEQVEAKKMLKTMPKSLVGLVKGETSSEISTLKKFVARTRQQLIESGAGSEIVDEKEVNIAGTRGKELIYKANAPPSNQRMKCVQRLAIIGEHNYVLLFQTLEDDFDAELALAAPLLDSFHTFN